ncbi:peptidyl-alpha-hydroxyglycine alpha-amidating lyase family protein [Sphingomonas sp. XMGL2]|uniref:Peptidyl-alpha-hydroxyglycine alpha-amidating lyase family protein n=2 Tax=Sphingomonas quercus TaxID=2842451 RepID=A0ABS6BN00_9SPHN|nr:peptidyl-alpha-hydroxyglycine alpha-amidating lyase family protein [Sphingomonas quercus]
MLLKASYIISPTLMQAMAAPAADPNGYPNPYKTDTSFFKLPAGRTMGSSSSVAVDSKGNIWIADRCGVNSCSDSPLDPIMQFDARGNFIKAFGGGMFNFPHGFYIDARDNIWVVDERVDGGKGGTVTKMDQNGKVLLTIGKAGTGTSTHDTFSEPNAVLVAPNGTIFVSEGHTNDKISRVVKYDANGKYIKEWGTTGGGAGQLNVPHTLAMDSKGRLFVGDRWNNRIQIYDQDGKLLDSWKQFGRPSGVYIDAKDNLYVADSESRTNPVIAGDRRSGYGHNPGWKRGIRVGSARTGQVVAFIPDTEPNPDRGATSGAEGIWADKNGVIYGAQVQQKAVVRYTK